MLNEKEEIVVPKESEITLNKVAISYLRSASSWVKFLSILGFVGIGILVILSLFIGTIFTKLQSTAELPIQPVPTLILSAIYLVLALVYFFPIFYLYKFAVKSKKSIETNSSEGIAKAMKYLYKHFQFVGVVALIIISLYAIVFIGSFVIALAF